MKKTSTLLAIGSGLFLSNAAQAELDKEFHIGYNSEYIYRGVDLGSDAFEYGLDFSGSCDCGLDWAAGIWFISPDNEDGNIDELDIYGEVSKDVGFGTLALGFTAYTYDSGADDSEVYLSASTELAGLSAGLSVFFGTDGILTDQVLIEGSLGYSFDFSNKVSGELSISAGYIADEGDGGYAGDDGYAYGNVSLSASYALSDEMTLSPYISYTDGQSDILGASAYRGTYAGVSLAYSF